MIAQGETRSFATHLSSRRLSIPERPLVLKGVEDVEVIFVMEDRDNIALGVLRGVGTLLGAFGGDGNGGEIDLLRHDCDVIDLALRA